MEQMTTEQLVDICKSLETGLKRTKHAYQTATPGVTYEDMQEAARRLLTFRRLYEQVSGRPVRSNPGSKAQVSGLLA